MITREFSTLQLLGVFSRVFPLKGAIIVGAGLGKGPWIDLLRQHDSNVLLIEAQDDRFKQLEKTFADFDGWHVQQHVVAAKQGEYTFYNVANSAESSLFSQYELSELWPQIKLKHQHTCQTTTLDKIGKIIDFDVNWLVVDCLPALSLLQGAEKLLSPADVVIVRVIIDEQFCRGKHASLQETEEFMQEHDFFRVSLEQELHAALGHGVYVRDYAELYQREAELVTEHKKKSEDLRCELQIVQKKTEHQQNQIEKLQTGNDAVNKNLAEYRIQLEKLTIERDKLIKEQDSTLSEVEELKKKIKGLQQATQDLDEQTKIGEEQKEQIDELQVTLAQLAKERDEKDQLAVERKVQIEQLTQTKEKIVKEKEEQEKFAKERLGKIDELKKQIQKKQNSNDDLLLRQQMMQEELARAEAQLDLIKDMVLGKHDL